MRFGQLVELRNSIRHSREVTAIIRNDGEAAIGWFTQALCCLSAPVPAADRLTSAPVDDDTH
jgi:hypothetical protein